MDNNVGQKDLENWFIWYDAKVSKWEREIRMYGKSNINIDELDLEAEVNRIKLHNLQLA